MFDFREQMHDARRTLHEVMREFVYYVAEPAADAVVLTARLHLSYRAIGTQNGSGINGYAELDAIVPKAVFMIDEVVSKGVSLERSGFIVTRFNGLLEIDRVPPDDGLTYEVPVSAVTKGNVARYGAERYNWDAKLPWCGMPDPRV